MTPERSFLSSTARLAIAYGAAVLLLVVALQGSVFLLTREALRNENRTMVKVEHDHLAEDYGTGGLNGLIQALRARPDSWGRFGAIYILADESLGFVAGNLTAWPLDVAPIDGHQVQFRLDATGDGTSSHPIWALVTRLPDNYWLLVGIDISGSERSLRRFGLATIWGVALITVLIGLLGWWYSRHTARRVRAISATCDAIVHSDLSLRLETGQRSDEFEQLSNTVNNMLARLEQQAVLLRTTFGSVAHDLRTPLYRLRMRLEEGLLHQDTSRATRELVAPVLDELDHVQRTLSTLLEIARAEAGGLAQGRVEVDLAALAREIGELYSPGMQDHGLQLRLAVADAAPVAGQRQLLAQLIANLLENALKYVPAGGEVLLAVRGDAANVLLEIADNGPGIPAEDRERAQRPFVRLHEGSGQPQGSGLGLSLVGAIARLHRGEVDLRDNSPGLRVICTFPRWKA